MDMNEKELLQNLLFDLREDFVLTEKPEGNLLEILSSLDKDMYEFFSIVNCESLVKPKELVKAIKNKLLACLENMNIGDIKGLKEIKEKGYTTIINDILLLDGIYFLYKENGEERITMPDDILAEALSYFDEEKIKMVKEAVIENTISVYNYLYGIYPVSLLIKGLSEKHYIDVSTTEIIKFLNMNKYVFIHKIDNEIYLSTRGYVLPKSLDFMKHGEYHLLSNKEEIEYTMHLASFAEFLLSIKKVDNPDLFFDFLVNYVLNEPKETNALIKDIKNKLGINITGDNVFELSEYTDEFRYFTLKGCTKEEYDASLFVLDDNPINHDLLSCLKLTSKEGINLLYEKYDCENIDDLISAIIADMQNAVYDFFASKTEAKEFIKQDGKYLKERTGVYLFSWGEFFLYKENDKYKLIVPKEIKEIVNDAAEEFFDFDV